MGAAPIPVVRCPRCRGGLVPLSVTELSELRCAICQGAWLDSPAVEALGEELGMRTRTFITRMRQALPPLLGALRCVRCRREMSRLRLRAVEVDACAGCGGMWLDAGELRRVSGGRWEDPGDGEILRRASGELPAGALHPPLSPVRQLLVVAADLVEDAVAQLERTRRVPPTVLLARLEEGSSQAVRLVLRVAAELGEALRRAGRPR